MGARFSSFRILSDCNSNHQQSIYVGEPGSKGGPSRLVTLHGMASFASSRGLLMVIAISNSKELSVYIFFADTGASHPRAAFGEHQLRYALLTAFDGVSRTSGECAIPERRCL
jgi:hypothetical protein